MLGKRGRGSGTYKFREDTLTMHTEKIPIVFKEERRGFTGKIVKEECHKKRMSMLSLLNRGKCAKKRKRDKHG